MLRTPRELDQDGLTDKGRAFRALFNETACERVRVWLQRSGVPLRDRDDVSQKVFLAAFRKFATYEPTRAPPDRWLHGITRRIAKQYWSWAKDTREDLTPDPSAEDVDEHPIADELIVRGEEATEAYDLLQRVELDLRWVLVLNLYDGVPVKEIAAERGIPLSTTYALRARALAAWLAVVEAYRREQAERMGEVGHLEAEEERFAGDRIGLPILAWDNFACVHVRPKPRRVQARNRLDPAGDCIRDGRYPA